MIISRYILQKIYSNRILGKIAESGATMFDAKEIALRALLRTERINAKRARARKLLISTLALCICVAGVLLSSTMLKDYRAANEAIIYDVEPVPLAETFQPVCDC